MNTTKKIITFCFILLGFTNLYAQNNKKDTIIQPPYDGPAPPEGMEVYTVVQVMPGFPGDIKKYLADSIRYPEDAKEKKVQGTVYINFIIEKNGSVSNIRILRSPDTILNAEAKRVISTMPNWTPGKQNGKPVRVQEMIPVHFKLKR
jgi:protein TonB